MIPGGAGVGLDSTMFRMLRFPGVLVACLGIVIVSMVWLVFDPTLEPFLNEVRAESGIERSVDMILFVWGEGAKVVLFIDNHHLQPMQIAIKTTQFVAAEEMIRDAVIYALRRVFEPTAYTRTVNERDYRHVQYNCLVFLYFETTIEIFTV